MKLVQNVLPVVAEQQVVPLQGDALKVGRNLAWVQRDTAGLSQGFVKCFVIGNSVS